MIDDKEFDFVAQLSHFGWGMAVIFGAKCLTPINSNLYLIFGALWIVYSFWKEFWYDYKYESIEVRGSSLKDFLFQAGGTIVGFLLITASKLWL